MPKWFLFYLLVGGTLNAAAFLIYPDGDPVLRACNLGFVFVMFFMFSFTYRHFRRTHV